MGPGWRCTQSSASGGAPGGGLNSKTPGDRRLSCWKCIEGKE